MSHNAPYNHFADKRELLTAVAATGYEALRQRMLSATADIEAPATTLAVCVLVVLWFWPPVSFHVPLIEPPVKT